MRIGMVPSRLSKRPPGESSESYSRTAPAPPSSRVTPRSSTSRRARWATSLVVDLEVGGDGAGPGLSSVVARRGGGSKPQL